MPARTGLFRGLQPGEAVAELLRQIDQPEMALVVFFASPSYDRSALAGRHSKPDAGRRSHRLHHRG